MAGLGIAWPAADEAVRDALDELLAANGLDNPVMDARVRLTVTGGLSDGRIRLLRSHPPTVIMTAAPLAPPTPREYRQGLALARVSFRQPWDSPLARIKTIHRLEYLMAREEAIAQGADDGVILDDRGHLAEGTSSNLALVRAGTVVTPTLDGPILPGVTREAALEAARAAGFGIEERLVAPEELFDADEVFATATSWEVLAVRSVDGRPVGAEGQGPATASIHAAFRELVRRETGRP